MRHVYWIGGGSGAGKSTIARRLADRHGWRLYATDDVMGEHARRTTPDEAPLLHEFMAMDMDERWVEDLLRMPRERCVVVEGFRLLPHLVRPLLTEPGHAVWLLPTPEFRQAALTSRATPAGGFTGRTSDPERANRNIAARDHMFTEHLREETARLGLPTVTVDLTMSEDELAERVSRVLRL
jgi:cytidylate kinase